MKLLITTSSFGKVDAKPLEALRQAGFDVTLNPHGRTLTIEESKQLMPGFDALIAGTEKLNNEVFGISTGLKYVCRLGAGMDSVDLHAAKEFGIPVENTPTAHVDAVAELALAGILDSLRKVSATDANIRKGDWVKPMGSLLKNKTLGIIGLGKVAKRLVELTKGFNLNILAYDLYQDKQFADENNISFLSLEDLLRRSDIVSIHTPYSKEARHMIGANQLSSLKKTALIINTSRGGLIDEDALFTFLTNNPTAFAYLDVFESEPYNGNLKDLNNILMTSHIGSYASEVRIQMESEAAQNVINFFKK